MIDERDVREMLLRRAGAVPTAVVDAPGATRRARRRLLAKGVVAMLTVAAIGAAALAGADAIRTAPVPADRPVPSPDLGVLRANGEVLRFTGVSDARGDLVAVAPGTGEERVLVENLVRVYYARWSADGRWVAYETPSDEGGREMWVVNAWQPPRLVATGGDRNLFATLALFEATWSPAGAELAAINGSKLITFDPVTGETIDLGPIDHNWGRNTLLSPDPAWSPDGTQIAIGARGGALYSVDARSGERSLLARLPGEDFDLMDEILWSPDGARIAVVDEIEGGGWRLHVMNADGSNVRTLIDDRNDIGPAGVAWSPDGTRLAYADWSEPDLQVRIFVAAMDVSAPVEIGTPAAFCHYTYECGLTWSPDGSQVAVESDPGLSFEAMDAGGSGPPQTIDEMTYKSWDGGSYSHGAS